MSRSVSVRVAVFVVLLVCAGCLQTVGEPERGHGTELSDRALIVSEENGSTTPSRIVAFEELPPKQQRVFERRVNGTAEFTRLPQSVDTDGWADYRHVRYQNETYAVTVSVP